MEMSGMRMNILVKWVHRNGTGILIEPKKWTGIFNEPRKWKNEPGILNEPKKMNQDS